MPNDVSSKDKELVKVKAEPFGDNVKFHGFDGNNGCSYMNIASFLINHLDRFTEFKRRDLNSHCPSIDVYRRMYSVYNQATLPVGKDLSVNQIIEILKAKVHPDNQ